MCLSPIKIPNRKILYREGLDKQTLTVSCGHCWQCVEQKCNQWLVRLNSVWQSFKDRNLPCYFLTVTYASEYRPTFGNSITDIRPDFPVFDKNAWCFDKEGVKQFFKELRKELGDGLKYFVVTEFGTDVEKQHLPHYHMLIFCPCQISESDFLTLCEFTWSKSVKQKYVPNEIIKWSKTKMVRDFVNNPQHHYIKFPKTGYWFSKQGSVYRFFKQQGWCMYSSEHPAQIESVNGLKYVLKYLHKETLSLSPSFQYFQSLKDYYKEKTSIDVDDDKLLRKQIRSCLPFFLASQGVGLDLYEDLKKYDAHTLVGRCKRGITVNDKSYPVPQYVTRKLFYDKNYIQGRDEPILCLNELGIQFYKEMFENSLQSMQSSMEKCFTFDVLRQIDFSNFKPERKGETVDSLISRFRHYSNIHKFAIPVYFYVYQDVSTYALTCDAFSPSADNLRTLCTLGYKLFDYKLDNYFVVYDRNLDGLLLDLHGIIDNHYHTCDYTGVNKYYYSTCNEFPCFEFMDDIISLFNYIYNYLWTVLLKDSVVDFLQNKKIKDAHYHLLKLFGYVS